MRTAKTLRPKRLFGLVIAMLLAMTLALQPVVVFADDANGDEDYEYEQEAAEYQEDEDEAENEADEDADDAAAEDLHWLFEFFSDLRVINLTEEAREIALYDFD